jgi:hypothetical protein
LKCELETEADGQCTFKNVARSKQRHEFEHAQLIDELSSVDDSIARLHSKC